MSKAAKFSLYAWLIHDVAPWARVEMLRAEQRREAASVEIRAIAETIRGIEALRDSALSNEAHE